MRWLSCLVLLLVACGAPKTTTADLGALLIQAGDLPRGVTAGPVESMPVPATMTKPQRAMMQQLSATDKTPAGAVSVLVFDDPAEVSKLYTQSPLPTVLSGLGDQAGIDTTNPDLVDITFMRCHALGAIRGTLKDFGTVDAITAYAHRLDDRLKASVC